MLSKKKKIIILVAMFALLVVTGYLNIALNNRVVEVDSENVISSADFYTTYRQDRQVARETSILYYESIISSETSSAEAKQLAEKSKQELVETIEKELVIEGLIKSKGFEDVVLSTTNENINVIIKQEELTTSEIAQIVQIIQEQTGKSLDNIKIIPTE